MRTDLSAADSTGRLADSPSDRWGRAAMASFFAASAATSTASNEQSWLHVASGAGSFSDWLNVISTFAVAGSSIAFALGRLTVAIAAVWIAYCVLDAMLMYPFWAVAPPAVAETASAFLSRIAVASSLALYISRDGAPR